MFRFRLQKILELRKQREKESATRLAAAREIAAAARQKQADLEKLREENAGALGSAAAEGRAVGELRSVELVVEHLDRQIQEARGASQAAEENVRRLLDEFTNALGERRAIDLLRERQLEEWKAQEAEEDRKTMDSVAIVRYTHRKTTPVAEETC